ncbi:MAG: T9SS type A sorting domain-containing protein [bacterium]
MKIIKFLAVLLISWRILYPADVSLAGYKLRQYNSSVTYTMPDTVLPEGYFLVICRGNKTQADFEAFWGVTLGSNVIFLDSVIPVIPQMNEAEIFSLHDASDAFLDSTTLPQLTTPKSIQRDSSNVMTFTYYSSSQANPGYFADCGFGAGLVISEIADTAGTGNYLYEFIEIFNDGGGAVNTPPLITSLTHTPAIPLNLQKVTASCNITDNVSVADDSLFYRVNSGSWQRVFRDSIAGNTRYYSIPGQISYSTVQYYASAKDDEGLTAVSDTNSYIVSAVSQTKVKKILFDYTKNQTAGNADWIIDTNWPVPLPANPAYEDDWYGGISSWGFELDTARIYNSNTASDTITFDVFTLPPDSPITYGTTRPMDLKNYDVYIVCEPQNPFTSAESTAIFNYVANGGGLFMVADHDSSDRDGDGWDSPQVWEALGSDNFGMHFYQVGEGNNNLSVSTTSYNSSNDTIVNGPFGSVIGGSYNFHAGTMIQQSAAALEVAIYNSSYSMLSVAFYGSHNGRVAGTGDSSPCDDSTGAIGDKLYDGWNEGIDRAIILNTTYWLSIDSLDYTMTTAVDALYVLNENRIVISLNIPNHFSYSSIRIFRKMKDETSFTAVKTLRSTLSIVFTDTFPSDYSGVVTYKIMGFGSSQTELAHFDVDIKNRWKGKTLFSSSDYITTDDNGFGEYMITDISGRAFVSNTTEGRIDLKELPVGIYFLRFKNSSEQIKIVRIK